MRANRITLHQILNLRKESGSDFRFDPELGVDLHVNNITRSCFFQLRQQRSIRRSLTMEATQTLVNSFVSSRVDYCNSIFYGATNAVLRRLQSVLDAANEHYEIRPHHACAQGSASLASHPPTHHFQHCNLRSKLTPWPWPDISQSILHVSPSRKSPDPVYCT